METDWWDDLYERGDPIADGPAPCRGAGPTERKDHGKGGNLAVEPTVPPGEVDTKSPPRGTPVPPHTPGMDREISPSPKGAAGLPVSNPGGSAAPTEDDLLEQEAAELDRRKKGSSIQEDTLVLKDLIQTVRDKIKIPQKKANTTKDTDTERADDKSEEREVAKETENTEKGNEDEKTKNQWTAALLDWTSSVRTSATKSAKKNKKSILGSTAAAWVISPYTFVALYDRIVLHMGKSMESFPRGQYLHDGGDPMGWGLFHGPAPWMRDTVGMAWESGQMSKVLVAAVLGILPLVLMDLGTYAEKLVGGISRLMTWVAGGGAAIYIAFGWSPNWWEVHMAFLFAAAWYGARWACLTKSELKKSILYIPLAAVITGSVLYSPGAMF